jgi:cell wall assembly regulator SMI1
MTWARTAAVEADVSALSHAWAELMTELDARAPASRSDVRPGTSDGPELVERELGIALPNELREWFTLHEGTGMRWDTMLLPSTLILSPSEAVDDSRLICNVWSEESLESAQMAREQPTEAGEIVYTWPAEYVMVGADGCGGGLFVDTRPGSRQGCVRWWDKTEADDDYGEGPIALSLAALIHTIAASLRDGTPAMHGLTATIQDGRLQWREPGEIAAP